MGSFKPGSYEGPPRFQQTGLAPGSAGAKKVARAKKRNEKKKKSQVLSIITVTSVDKTLHSKGGDNQNDKLGPTLYCPQETPVRLKDADQSKERIRYMP